MNRPRPPLFLCLVLAGCALGRGPDGDDDIACDAHTACATDEVCNLVRRRCEPATRPGTAELVAQFECTFGDGNDGGTAYAAFRFGGIEQEGGGLCFGQRFSDTYGTLSIFSGGGRYAVTVEFDPSVGAATLDVPAGALVFIDDFEGPSRSVARASGGTVQIEASSPGLVRGALRVDLLPTRGVGEGCAADDAACGSVAVPFVCLRDDPSGAPTCRARCADGACGAGERCVASSSGAMACVPDDAPSDGRCERAEDCVGEVCVVGQLGEPAQGYCRARCTPGSPTRCGPGHDVCLVDRETMSVGACVPNPCSLGVCEAGLICDPTSYVEAQCVPGGVLTGTFDAFLTTDAGTAQVSGSVPGVGAWPTRPTVRVLRVASNDIVVLIDGPEGLGAVLIFDDATFTPLTSGEGSRTFVPKWDMQAGLYRNPTSMPEPVSGGVSGLVTFTRLGDQDGARVQGSFEIAFERVSQ